MATSSVAAGKGGKYDRIKILPALWAKRHTLQKLRFVHARLLYRLHSLRIGDRAGVQSEQELLFRCQIHSGTMEQKGGVIVAANEKTTIERITVNRIPANCGECPCATEDYYDSECLALKIMGAEDPEIVRNIIVARRKPTTAPKMN